MLRLHELEILNELLQRGTAIFVLIVGRLEEKFEILEGDFSAVS